jgi:transcriptional regulator with XRE-family HTH domain
MVSIGARIRDARRRRVLTQKELAELAGLPRVTLVRIETDRQQPRPSTLRRLAKALGLKPQELLEDP